MEPRNPKSIKISFLKKCWKVKFIVTIVTHWTNLGLGLKLICCIYHTHNFQGNEHAGLLMYYLSARQPKVQGSHMYSVMHLLSVISFKLNRFSWTRTNIYYTSSIKMLLLFYPRSNIRAMDDERSHHPFTLSLAIGHARFGFKFIYI